MAEPVVSPTVVPVVNPAIPPVVPVASWIDKLDPEIKGHIQTQGWDKLDPTAAAVEAVKKYREAEKVAGIPIDEVARIPKDPADKTAWDILHARLGIPQDKTAYSLNGLKAADGTEVDAKLASRIQDAAFDLKMRPDQAQKVTTEVLNYLAETKKETAAAQQQTALQELEKLKVSWGPHFDLNNMIVDRTATRLGMTPEHLKTISNAAGASATFELLLNLGTAMGEARFVTGQNPADSGVRSVEQAISRKAEIMNASKARKLAPEELVKVSEELRDLDRIIVSARHASR